MVIIKAPAGAFFVGDIFVYYALRNDAGHTHFFQVSLGADVINVVLLIKHLG
ncbi:hypothetical protein [Mixta calida]|uniref:hypothetical protein n=1 Tax=Mixta calida TaxID=665913 RepID=UPI001380B8F5|nr:hypothetical protein [Mixta calida]KAF0857597.1 hypothetical protein Y888_21100 [Mixta calida B021323]